MRFVLASEEIEWRCLASLEVQNRVLEPFPVDKAVALDLWKEMRQAVFNGLDVLVSDSALGLAGWCAELAVDSWDEESKVALHPLPDVKAWVLSKEVVYEWLELRVA